MATIKFIEGNIFDTDCEAIVCPVNCVGVLGAGLAKAFRDNKIYEEANREYKEICLKGQMAPGSVFLSDEIFHSEAASSGPQKKPWHVLYVATKFHWSDSSKMEWIEHGLFNLRRVINYKQIYSIALPLIGSGLGGLTEPAVEIQIKEILGKDDNKDRLIEVYRWKK